MTLQPFEGHFTKVQKLLDCIHLYIAGPISLPSASGQCYFLTIFDDLTSYKMIFFIKHRSEAYSESIKIKNIIKKSQERNIKRIASNRGGKFRNKNFKQLTEESGIPHTFTPACTPRPNGFSE
ncbi:hypothetical protein O181_004752 [Austropuccinia psidii MF-1]|uniref:Integrase catalytic domain-containing protein n=1 Tax=Austropuccinia psidii MF-1 TaxID=1389203 RepID=A0A9Q3BGV9_9BASI|nr:hypothetical protein [Austropuccinia psidii MF-1]